MMITALYIGEGVGIRTGRREFCVPLSCVFHGRRRRKQDKYKWR